MESVGYIVMTYLLARQSGEAAEYVSDTRLMLKMTEAYIAAAETYIANSEGSDVALINEVGEQY